MATCPECGGFLSDDHRCFGMWRRRARGASVAVAGAASGIVVSLLSSGPEPAITAIAAVLGAVVATAVWRELT